MNEFLLYIYASSYRIPINNYHIYSRNIYIIFKSGRKYYEILRKKTQIHIIYCTLLNTMIVRKSCFCNNLVTFREVPKSVLAYIWG